MDVVTVKGVEYQRASKLAKRFKYTSDYVGQLCRQNKVDARLVGRSWYVNPESLKEHKQNRYHKKDSTKDEKTSDTNTKTEKSRVDVAPVLTNKTTKVIRDKAKNFSKRIDWKPVKYEYDETELLPKINQSFKDEPDSSQNLAEPNNIMKEKTLDKITETKPKTSKSLPLQGKITVLDLDDDTESENTINKKTSSEDADITSSTPDETPKNKDNLVKPEKKETVALKSDTGKKSPVTKKTDKPNKNNLNKISTAQSSAYPDCKEASLTPQSVQNKNKSQEKPTTLLFWLYFIVFILMAVLLLTLFLDFNITITENSFNKQFNFSLSTFSF